MSSARLTGTNESVSTFGAGQTYTALSTWEADTDVNNVTLNQSPVLACLAAQYDLSCTLAGATNDATRFRIIRPQAGNFHTGIRDTGVQFYRAASADWFILNESNTQVQDCAFRLTGSATTSPNTTRISSSASGHAGYIGCIINGSVNSGTGFFAGLGAFGTGFAVDTIVENVDGEGFDAESGGVLTCYNCTGINLTAAKTAFKNSAGTMTCKNCLGVKGSGVAFAGTITATNCASDDATADDNGGTGHRINQTFTFVNAGSHDYHLSTSDGGAKDFGTDLSADATYAFTDDIDRNTFSTWDIGFDSVDTASASPKRLTTLGIGNVLMFPTAFLEWLRKRKNQIRKAA